MSVEDTWKFILGHISHCIDTYIPKSSNKKGITKPNGWTIFVLGKLKRKTSYGEGSIFRVVIRTFTTIVEPENG